MVVLITDFLLAAWVVFLGYWVIGLFELLSYWILDEEVFEFFFENLIN